MITGFNTDIQHDGVTYHVQTEDKGIDTPLILSLIYVGGAIIASKRTPYDDLIAEGFDESALTERLQRQHKLLCAAIRNGRIEDLKRMGEKGGAAAKSAGNKTNGAGATRTEAATTEEAKTTEKELSPTEAAAIRGDVSSIARNGFESDATEAATPTVESGLPADLEAVEAEEVHEAEPLYLSLLDDDGEFRAGQLATIKIRVGRGQFGHTPVADAPVSIKVLGTTFRPLILSTSTDEEGLAVVRALLPGFTSGRAAIIIRAGVDGESAELRRIIHQSL